MGVHGIPPGPGPRERAAGRRVRILMDPLLTRLRSRMDPSAPTPVYRQVVDAIWEEVIVGDLPAGHRLPTARQLSVGLSVNPRSAQRIYRELERLGVAITRPGEGTFVGLAPASREERQRRRQLAELAARAVEEAAAHGFEVDDLLEEIREHRTPHRDTDP
ncbi:MAG: GntR family transcriptional regulator [Gemmatimonadales bacterium]|nr:MAG: GntR family transcriptional regulator [Gemmatimonadales bacterium]